MAFTSLMAVPLSACGGSVGEKAENHSLLQVYTSIYPLYDFTQKIGGELVDVHHMMPPGVEGHDFEPMPRDMAALHEADLFIYNGAGYEAWADKALATLDKEKTYVVNATEGLPLLTNEASGRERGHEDDDGHHGDEDDGTHGHGEGHGMYDPHVWLDPHRAKLQAKAIKDALVKIDGKHADAYEANYNRLAAQFDALDTKLKKVVRKAARKEIVVSHASLGYLAQAYGLKQISISGLSPSDEPTQKDLQKIIEFARAHDVKYILFETLVSSNLAETVKNEAGAKALMFNPLENLTKEEIDRGEDFFSVMEKNIDHLETALSAGR